MKQGKFAADDNKLANRTKAGHSSYVSEEQPQCDWCHQPLTDDDLMKSRLLGLDSLQTAVCSACFAERRLYEPPEGWPGSPSEWPFNLDRLAALAEPEVDEAVTCPRCGVVVRRSEFPTTQPEVVSTGDGEVVVLGGLAGEEVVVTSSSGNGDEPATRYVRIVFDGIVAHECGDQPIHWA
jgi:hypothetical protein